MKTKTINTRKVILRAAFAAALCSCAVFAQDTESGADWDEGFEEQAAPAAAPAEAPPVGVAAQASQAAIIDAESNMRVGYDISAEALAAAPFLRARGSPRAGEGRVRRPRDRNVYLMYDNITVAPAGGAFTVKSGDTVDILKSGRWVSFDGGSAQIVSRVGRGAVIGFAGNRAIVKLTEIWGTITGGESIAKRSDFEPLFCDRLEVINPRVGARVVARVDDTEMPYLQQYLIINKGGADGVKLGDFFRVIERRRHNHLSQNILDAQVVSLASNSATLVVRKLYREQVAAGDEAFSSYRTVVSR